MPVRYFCDRDGNEIGEDEGYFSVAISQMVRGDNSTRAYEHSDRYRDENGNWIDISLNRSMLCKSCAILISTTIRESDS